MDFAVWEGHPQGEKVESGTSADVYVVAVVESEESDFRKKSDVRVRLKRGLTQIAGLELERLAQAVQLG